MLRQPIIAVLGHVDHGKTSLLDRIRSTAVAAKEAGGITQSIGTTEIPKDVVASLCKNLLDKFGFKINVPGLLFIDTPGHEAFTTLRKRGGTIADMAILVIDINEGIMPQTEESIRILKDAKTPFVVAINKIDRLQGWVPGDCFLDNYSNQDDEVKSDFEKRFYEITEQLRKSEYETERFDRVTDFKKTVAAVPVSAKTGEGIPDLLVTLIGLSQSFLKEKLLKKSESEGMVLEVKDVTGLGTAIDCIIYDGTISKNDFVAIAGRMPMIAKIKSLLMPSPLRDIRAEKKFQQVNKCNAACGVRISAAGLDDVIAGSQIRTAKTFEGAEKLLDSMEKEVEEVEIHRETDGVILKAANIGGLEALINIFKNCAIEEASIGPISKQDIVLSSDNAERFHRTVIGFDAPISAEAEQLAKDRDVKIFTSDVIYHLREAYDKWVAEAKEEIRKKEIESLKRPAKIRFLKGLVFRASNPAIIGCEILAGVVKPETRIFVAEKDIGEIKQIQSQGKNIDQAKTNDKVAISISGPAVGRQINEGDIFYTDISSDDYKKLKKNSEFLSASELEVLEEIASIKRKKDHRYGL